MENQDRGNLVDLATVIQNAIKEYQLANPDDHSQTNASNAAMRAAMRFGKGTYNPATIQAMINIERSVWNDQTILLC